MPELATESTAGCSTVTITSSVAVSLPSETVSRNPRVATPPGAVNVGFAVVGPVRVTAVPLVWAHWYVNTAPSGSDDADPSNVTTAPAPTD